MLLSLSSMKSLRPCFFTLDSLSHVVCVVCEVFSVTYKQVTSINSEACAVMTVSTVPAHPQAFTLSKAAKPDSLSSLN